MPAALTMALSVILSSRVRADSGGSTLTWPAEQVVLLARSYRVLTPGPIGPS